MLEAMKIGKRTFPMEKHTYVCGILNVTPDSFSDGGKYNTLDRALQHAQQMLEEGADLIDVGGESTRPGYQMISEEEEIERVSTVISAIRRELDPVISIDTYKSKVAQAAIDAGADLVNDIWGFQYDAHMANVVAETGTACCLMHNRKEAVYEGNFMETVMQDLKRSVELAMQAGISKNRIMIDPGVGFAKSYEENLIVMNQIRRLGGLELPVLLGASRKSVVGLTLDLPKEQRLEGTLATTAYAVLNGCDFVRVHDVKEHVRLIKMLEAILHAG